MATAPTEDPKTLKELVARWLLGQEAIVVVLFMILGVTGWLGHYGLTQAIPSHLQQIQTGYEKNAATLKEAVEKCCDDRKELLEIIRDERARKVVGNTN